MQLLGIYLFWLLSKEVVGFEPSTYQSFISNLLRVDHQYRDQAFMQSTLTLVT